MKYYHKNRLLKLADFLDTVPRKKFNLYDWITKKSDNTATTIDHIKKCGFAGCAVGWAMTLPSFKKAGLKSMGRQQYRFQYGQAFSIPYYKGKENWFAVAEFFGVVGYDAEELFSVDSYSENATPKMVARRIRKFVKKAT